MEFKLVTTDDLNDIIHIYDYYIRNTAVNFDYTVDKSYFDGVEKETAIEPWDEPWGRF